MEGDAVGLVADVGRVAVRFALTGGPLGHGLHAIEERRMDDHPTFTDALLTYLGRQGLGGRRLRSVLAVAGAARGDVIHLTNSRWYISLPGLQAVLGVRPEAINECAVATLALPMLKPGEVRHLVGGPLRPVDPAGSYLLVAPRLGLGVAGLIGGGARLKPVPTEAGHIRFVPETADEVRVAEALHRRGGLVNLEAILSAAGLGNVHAALAGATSPLPGEEVIRAAARDPAAAEALRLYSGALGAAIGDLVLAIGAWEGVFLNGAFARVVAPRLAAAAIAERLQRKGAFRRQLAQVPVALVLAEDLELKGAAAALGR